MHGDEGTTLDPGYPVQGVSCEPKGALCNEHDRCGSRDKAACEWCLASRDIDMPPDTRTDAELVATATRDLDPVHEAEGVRAARELARRLAEARDSAHRADNRAIAMERLLYEAKKHACDAVDESGGCTQQMRYPDVRIKLANVEAELATERKVSAWLASELAEAAHEITADRAADEPGYWLTAALERLAHYDELYESFEAEHQENERLREEMEGFATWADSYPTSVWLVPDADALKRAHEALKAAGLGGIDALSAMLYRHALTHISERARAALRAYGTTDKEAEK